MNMPHPVAANANGITSATTDTGPVVGLYAAYSRTDGTHSTVTKSAGRAGRCTANDDRASRPAGVDELDTVPSSRQATATATGNCLRPHRHRQARAPAPTSMLTAVADHGSG